MRTAACVALIVLAAATPARAQSPRPPALTVGVSVGHGKTLRWDFPFASVAWSASVQYAPAKHLIIEGAIGGWRDAVRRRFSNITLESSLNFYSATVNAVATAAFGRLRFSSGAGAGLGSFKFRTTGAAITCQSPLPHACDQFAESVAYRALAVQGVLEADIAVTHRVQAFVVYRLGQPLTQPLGDISITAGARLAIR
jgi:hypothetical protein